MDVKDEPPIKESEFNSSIATLRRLDEIKKYLDKATVEDNPDNKFFHLKAFWIELDPIISKTYQQLQLKKYEASSEKYYTYKKNQIEKIEVTAFLDEWDIELRRIDQEYNLNMKMGRDKRWVV